MLRIQNGRDFLGGAIMVAIGVLFLWFGRDLDVGTSFQMGPGYFPTMLSLLLSAIGALLIVQSVLNAAEQDEGERANWKAYGLVIGAPVFFGLALSGLGLAPTMFIMLVAVGFASQYANWRHSIALALFMTVSSVFLFTRLLALPVSAFGPWLPFGG